MAGGALLHSRAQIAVAITGIAGPAGGTAGQARRDGVLRLGGARRHVEATTQRFAGDREAIRRQAVIHALQGVLERTEP